jgi:fructose-bisphosphate aldolase class I
VEPDIDWAGSDADLRKSVEVHVKIISMLYARCAAYGVLLEGEYSALLVRCIWY